MPVPEAAEIREMLRGKTTSERRVLLAEIEKARQSQIHLTYMMEKQALQNEEKWAHRNFEERQNMIRLINAANNTRPATGTNYLKEKYSPMMTT